MEKHIMERITELISNEDLEALSKNSIYNDFLEDIHVETAEQVEGQYHFWLDADGFCKGDATPQQIEKDLVSFKVPNEDQLFSTLNSLFIKILKINIREVEL